MHGQQSQPGLHTTNQEFVWPCNKLLQELAKLGVCLPSASSPRALLLPFQLNPDSLLLRAMSHSPLNTVSLFHQSSWRVELHENLQGGKSEGNSQWFIEELFSWITYSAFGKLRWFLWSNLSHCCLFLRLLPHPTFTSSPNKHRAKLPWGLYNGFGGSLCRQTPVGTETWSSSFILNSFTCGICMLISLTP